MKYIYRTPNVRVAVTNPKDGGKALISLQLEILKKEFLFHKWVEVFRYHVDIGILESVSEGVPRTYNYYEFYYPGTLNLAARIEKLLDEYMNDQKSKQAIKDLAQTEYDSL